MTYEEDVETVYGSIHIDTEWCAPGEVCLYATDGGHDTLTKHQARALAAALIKWADQE